MDTFIVQHFINSNTIIAMNKDSVVLILDFEYYWTFFMIQNSSYPPTK